MREDDEAEEPEYDADARNRIAVSLERWARKLIQGYILFSLGKQTDFLSHFRGADDKQAINCVCGSAPVRASLRAICRNGGKRA